MISVSAIPGGNPTAKADPESFAVEWLRCPACGPYWCDRCGPKEASIAQGRKCPRCGGALVGPSAEHARDLMFGRAQPGSSVVANTRVEPPRGGAGGVDATPQEPPKPAQKPWWKFW